MTEIKIEGKLPSSAGEAIGEHARPLYDRLGSTRMVIAELRASHRVTPGPGEDKKPTVSLRIAAMEVANKDQEDYIRKAQQALYLARTARGTLTGDGQIELSDDTVRLLGDSLAYEEAARLRAGLEHWATEMARVAATPTLLDGEIRHEVERIKKGLQDVLHPARQPEDADTE